MNDLRPDGCIWDATYHLDSDGRPVPVAHDVTVWTERTENRLKALEDAVNRIADQVTYLLLRLDDEGK